MTKRYIYAFDDVNDALAACNGSRKELVNLLGGKGGNLGLINQLGVPVPKGFTITTEACTDFYKQDPPAFPPGLWEAEEQALKRLEKETGKEFGSKTKPLLVSCRSGARISMPGMMDTVLNIGLNDDTAEAMIELTKNPRFVWDSYRRFLQGYGAIVMGVPDEVFEAALKQYQTQHNCKGDMDCTADDWKALVGIYKEIIVNKTGNPFPQNPIDQIKASTLAVFNSWNSERAIAYRNNFKIPHDYGTAVNIMSMVFGNMGDTSATGVAFTRDPSTGENALWGEFLVNAQGEDVVAGVRTASKIAEMQACLPECYKQFQEITQKLEKHFKDMQDVEFTIEQGKLWMLQTRVGKRTAAAAVKIACDMVAEGLITKEEAVSRINSHDVDTLLHPHFTDADIKAASSKIYTTGVNASPGAGVGKIYFTAEKCKERAKMGEKVVMVRQFTKPDDISGMLISQGVITAEGGAASHAAVVARQLGIPAVVGCSSLNVDFENLTVTANGVTFKEGDVLSLNGSTGIVYACAIPLTTPKLEDQKELLQILTWADEIRSAPDGRPSVYSGPTRGLKVYANADTPKDAKTAIGFGAEGIGLCRTEHMFLGERAILVRQMILATEEAERDECLEKLRVIQTEDFTEIFQAMSGLPTIIRLIDPPLHEFLPEYETLVEDVAILRTKKECGAQYDAAELSEKEMLLAKSRSMKESNPMIGTRGVRLCLVIPGLVKMQVTAIMEGACLAQQKGAKPIPEIMIPLTMNVTELARIKPTYDEICAEIFKKYNTSFPVKFGTMMEVPRACLTSEEMATVAEFYSFGTNDLHQMTLGLSRDDSEGTFLQDYYHWGLFKDSPFQTIDQTGVGKLMKIAVKHGRKTRKELEVGICGEHGGDPRSINFCHNLGMNYVSCSPFRVPIARLSAAQAVILGKQQK